MTTSGTDDSKWPTDAISGTWHLVGQEADEVNIPQHRVDLRFVQDQDNIRGSVLNRVTGEEMPMIRHASFDGERLEVAMIASVGQEHTEPTTLVMTVDGTRLLGHWQHRGVPMGPRLKLVRARG
ncbi:MAG: hypothetical protein IPL75_05760 [Acidobacteria bacterium]|jgi:hypothetical protein|nr:hypothetical protein [Acidobacteriota bacterium]